MQTRNPNMRRRNCASLLMPVVSLFVAALPGSAQTAGPCGGAQQGKVACLFSDVVGGTVRTIDPSFRLDPRLPLGTSVITTQLTSTLPAPAPVSGYLYRYDPDLGTVRAERQSYGSIFAERAETIGFHQFAIGFTSQTFVFDKVDGLNLHDQASQLPAGEFIAFNRFNHDLKITQQVFTAVYGIHNRIDVSAAIPFSSVYYGLGYNGTYVPLNTSLPTLTAGGGGHRSASGLGDISVQVKGTLFRTERAAVAFGTSLRLPTGDAYNALGSGAAGIRPFVAASVIYKKFSPHVNLGYLFNGRSVLAADNILSGQKGRIPSQVQYAAGVDAGVTQRLTVAFDILGFDAIHAGRVHANSLQPFTRESFNVINGAAGFKARLFGNVLFQANLLFKLNDAGVRSKVVPLVGFSYHL